MDVTLTKTRLEALADGIFAIAMTLLVLNIKLPVMTHAEAVTGLGEGLRALWPHFFAFGLSFFLLANFWMIHHRQFHFIDKVDVLFIWLNILMLAFIALVPFSTMLIGEYEVNVISPVFFNLNLLAIGLSMLAYWLHATSKRRLVRADVTDRQIKVGRERALILPAVSLAAAGLAFVTPEYSTLTYLAIPVLLGFVLRRNK